VDTSGRKLAFWDALSRRQHRFESGRDAMLTIRWLDFNGLGCNLANLLLGFANRCSRFDRKSSRYARHRSLRHPRLICGDAIALHLA